MNTNYKLFISYATADIALANRIKEVFRKQGMQAYIAQYDLPLGAKLTEEIKANIQNCDLFCVLWSRNAKASNWVEQEIGIANAYNKPIIPLVLEQDYELPGFIRGLRYLCVFAGAETALLELRDSVLSRAAQKEMKEKKMTDAVVVVGLVTLLLLVVFSKE